MADFVFMLLASGSRPARVKVLRMRLGANEIALRVAKTTVFPLSTFVRFREIVAKLVFFSSFSLGSSYRTPIAALAAAATGSRPAPIAPRFPA
jgi:hypothetical protein